ncbi:MAG: C25 family cysteine peptidase, partial [Paludibacter sp.]|nr:C25 family cysteine peptidase [Paludibacter sp.]
MKRNSIILLFFLFALAVSAQSIHHFSEKSVLANGKFVKIKIVQSGVYRLTFDDLKAMGISNPANARIFGYGGNVLEQDFSKPMIDDLPEIAIYAANDYILFYANGIDKWTYDANSKFFTHLPNTYSSFGYYFVTSDAGIGRRIEQAQAVEVPQNATVHDITEFTDYQVHEQEERSVAKAGKTFYGEKFEETTFLSMNINFSSPNPSSNTNSVVALLDAAAFSTQRSSFVLALGNKKDTLNIYEATGQYTKAVGAKGKYSYTPSGDNLNFTLTFKKTGINGTGYLNALTINAIRQLKMSGAMMRFQNLDFLGSNVFKKYKLSNAGSNVKIWNITDTENIMQMPVDNAGGTLNFTVSAEKLQKFIAVDLSAVAQLPKPEVVGAIANQNLHALPATDFVIITHPNFMQQAERLAQAHRDADNMRVEVVTAEQVYNEFSSGTPDATAYRRLLKMLYNRALTADDKPKYLLLFGRGTYDNRKLLTTSGQNLVLTYQADNSLVFTSSFVTDDYFVLLDDNEG